MKNQIYLTREEAAALQMALSGLLEDFKKCAQMPEIPWTPEARKYMKDITAAANSAADKIERFTGLKKGLPPFNPGDENEFLTKPS